MSRYAKIKFNDVVNGKGINLSVFFQGCPHRCKGCFNQETWDFNGGQIFSDDTIHLIINKLNENEIKRNLSILGGEPLCEENRESVAKLIKEVKAAYPETRIYLWTGYLLEDLISLKSSSIDYILLNIDYLIDGPYIENLRDLTLELRGSSNQRVIKLN